MIKVLGLMTCYNRKEKTVRVLNTLIKNNDCEFDFIVLDDNSTDGTYEALCGFPNVSALRGDGGMYYSGGMRRIINQALNLEISYDYCLLFNDDVDFYDGSIDYLIKRCDGESIMVGPTCDDSGVISYGGVIKTSVFRPSFKKVKGYDDAEIECDTFNANCVLIPWQKFKMLGNIDDKYTHSLGDFDYGFSAKRNGISIRVAGEFVGVCCNNPIKGSWRDTTLTRKERIQLKETPKGLPRDEWFYYLKKNYSVSTAIVYSIIPYMRIILKK